MKRIKQMMYICISEADPTLCNLHVTYVDNTWDIFYHGDRVNFKRALHQFDMQARENKKLDEL